jgi:hypothetical protein
LIKEILNINILFVSREEFKGSLTLKERKETSSVNESPSHFSPFRPKNSLNSFLISQHSKTFSQKISE